MKIRGRLVDHSLLAGGRQRITIETTDDFRDEYDRLKEKEVSAEIKAWRKPRSMDANAYAWVLIDKLAGAMGITKTEVYRELIRNIGGVSEIVCVRDNAVEKLRESWQHNGLGWFTETFGSKIEGCTNVILFFGSSTYDSKQMSALIDTAVEECKQYGIETLTPDQLAQLEGLAPQ